MEIEASAGYSCNSRAGPSYRKDISNIPGGMTWPVNKFPDYYLEDNTMTQYGRGDSEKEDVFRNWATCEIELPRSRWT